MTVPSLTRPLAKPAHWIAAHHVAILMIATLALFPFGTGHQLPLAILAVIGLVRAARADGRAWAQPEVRLFLWVYGLIFIPLAISMLTAVDPGPAVRTSARYLAFLFVGLAVLLAHPTGTLTRALMWAILVIPTLWVLDAVIQLLLGTNVLGYPADGTQPTGLFHPRRSIGIFLAHLLPLYLEALRRLLPGRPWIWLLIIPYLAVILLAGARASWLTAILAVAAYGLYLAIIYRVSWRRMIAPGIAILAAGMAAVLFSPGLQDRLDRTAGLLTLDFESWDHATSYRMSIWSAASRVFQDHWLLGVGARGFTPTALEAGYLEQSFSHVHLFILDVPVTTGVIGLAGYLAVMGIVLVWYLRQAGLRAALFASWLAVVLALFPLNAHWNFYGTFFTALLWFIFLVAMIMYREERASPAERGP
jgi:O-antigen ligase